MATSPLSKADVAKAANEGSFQKAVALNEAGAAQIIGHYLDGTVQVSVQSEKGQGSYTVEVANLEGGLTISARCTCLDFKRRGGLCKHGAAAVMVVMHQGHAQSPCLGKTCFAAGKSKVPRSNSELHSLKRLPATPSKRSHGRDQDGRERDGISSPEEVPEAVKKPRFPSAPSSGGEAKKNSAVKAALILRQLHNAASAGDSDRFLVELRRFGAPLGEADALGLLHKAIVAPNASGAALIVEALSALPEGMAAASSSRGATSDSRRTPLHVAATSQRADICRLLLAARADPQARDAQGQTALELARRRRLDATGGAWRNDEDAVQDMLRQALAERQHTG
eukprot:TRINITY_DN61350_c0_g1_i1.p1 TRINITY_DN61350_c0_g1~~TRINITY_DN61350_c0_g1_i1.p1  ORF type:complete len:353 (+),score=57.15 TRINITY_DN61350_c0_g1_i1:45-1061(+)